MPNWSVTANGINSTVTVGESTALTLDITISPSGGYSIAPNNFVIGGATETDGNGNQTLVETNTWEGGNVDNIVEKVEFIQAGNEVDVLARVYCEAASFVADSDIYIDIDENPNNVVTNDVYGVCTKIDYPYSANATVTITANPDGSTTVDDIQTGDASNNWIKKLTRYGDDIGAWTGLVVLQITPATDYHLVGTPTVQVTTPPGVEGLFQTLASSDGLVYITHKPSEATQSLTPCELGNIIYIDYTIEADAVTSTDTIHGVSSPPSTTTYGGGLDIVVNGDAGAQYDITVQRPDGGGWDYYNWDGTYVSSSASETGTIGSNGTFTHTAHIPSSSSNVTYSITISSVGGSTLGPDVPTLVTDKKIYQYGKYTSLITAITDDTAQYGTIPASIPEGGSIIRPIRYDNDPYGTYKSKQAVVKGKTSGSSTRVRLSTSDPSLKAGMIITGKGIPYDTTILNITKGTITLSNSVDLSATQNMICYTNKADTVPFSFTITPNSTPNTLSVNTSNDHYKSVWGIKRKQTTINGDQAGSTSLIVNDSHGIRYLQTPIGNGLSNVSVVSVDYSTHTVTLNQAHTGVVDGDTVTFKGMKNPDVSVAYIEAQQAGDDIKIKGYLTVPKLEASAPIHIFLDDIINAT